VSQDHPPYSEHPIYYRPSRFSPVILSLKLAGRFNRSDRPSSSELSVLGLPIRLIRKFLLETPSSGKLAQQPGTGTLGTKLRIALHDVVM
jgi:hypothetical protein